jgi:hypothetical protein
MFSTEGLFDHKEITIPVITNGVYKHNGSTYKTGGGKKSN